MASSTGTTSALVIAYPLHLKQRLKIFFILFSFSYLSFLLQYRDHTVLGYEGLKVLYQATAGSFRTLPASLFIGRPMIGH
jgi:hypothetical protein